MHCFSTNFHIQSSRNLPTQKWNCANGAIISEQMPDKLNRDRQYQRSNPHHDWELGNTFLWIDAIVYQPGQFREYILRIMLMCHALLCFVWVRYPSFRLHIFQDSFIDNGKMGNFVVVFLTTGWDFAFVIDECFLLHFTGTNELTHLLNNFFWTFYHLIDCLMMKRVLV